MKSYFSLSFCQRQITLLSLPWKTGPLNTYNLSKLLIFQIWLVHSTSSYFVSSISVSFKGLSINYVVWILNICDPSYRSYPTNIRRHQFFWGRVLGRKWKMSSESSQLFRLRQAISLCCLSLLFIIVINNRLRQNIGCRLVSEIFIMKSKKSILFRTNSLHPTIVL